MKTKCLLDYQRALFFFKQPSDQRAHAALPVSCNGSFIQLRPEPQVGLRLSAQLTKDVASL
jgi:hypothetical protein